MPETSDPRLYHAHVARNRAPILDVLKRVLPSAGLVVEIASGSGEHAAFFAKALPGISWQPTDIDARRACKYRRAPRRSRRSQSAGAAASRYHGGAVAGRTRRCGGVQQHDSYFAVGGDRRPDARCEPHFAGGGILFLYGPYKIDGRHTAPSNEEFDASLRARNAEWGIRDLGDVTALAARHGFALAETVPMPANNLSVVFRRGP